MNAHDVIKLEVLQYFDALGFAKTRSYEDSSFGQIGAAITQFLPMSGLRLIREE